MLKNKDMATNLAAGAGGPAGEDQAKAGMNKKEREAYDADKAKEAYMQRTLAGETEEARK